MPKKLDIILSEALVEKGLVTQDNLGVFLKEAESLNESLQQFLIKRGILPETDILNVLGVKLKLSCVNLKEISIDKDVLAKVPVKIALYYKFVPVRIKDKVLTIAVSSPLEIKTEDEVRAQLGYDIELALCCSGDILESLKKYYGLAADTLEKISSNAHPGEASQETHFDSVEDIEKLAEDASVIRLVNQIILEGFRKRATDIHIEPYREELSLRYRIDGLLYDANFPPEIKNFLNAIISRIKIMSNLNIVERRLPQDGRAIVKVGEEMLDLRISTIPTPFGESVVIRILPTQMLFSMEKLGLGKKDLQVFEGLIKKPHGIIFVTGPTGSGKTTTLYACLSRINTKDRKIITIEDPIEYEMSGITQIQVSSDIGLDFARGLRSILRHDPDVIMVGEVRDLETAEIAIRVALTGHLVFSTLHTNDAASAITRLIDIGVEPFLLASSVEAFIAQRLIRLICPDCKIEDNTIPVELKELVARDISLKSLDEVKVFKGKGCPSCNFTGFFGRTAIYEILSVDEAMKDLILKKATATQIKRLALLKGMRTLRQDGWHKVVSGETTPEEVVKVTSAEEYAEDDKNTRPFTSNPPRSVTYQVPNPDEKRAYLRLDSKVNLRYKVFDKAEKLLKKGFKLEEFTIINNLSAGGLVFLSDDKLAVDLIVELNLELPDGEEPVGCLARVVRVEEHPDHKGYNVAACFLDISSAERSRLGKYVELEMEMI